MTAPDFLDCAPDRRLGYNRLEAVGDGAMLPGIVFLGGLRSDRTGTKAMFLEDWCRARGRAYLRFDYTGHGESTGRFEDGCIGDWLSDAEEALTRLTEGPQVLVGSSMGGWVALLLALRHPGRLAGLVGIAAAPDFTEDLMWGSFDEGQRRRLMEEGRVDLPSEYGEPTPVTRRMIEDGRMHLLLRGSILLPAPVHLLHGTADADVPVGVATRLLERLETPDARLTLVKDADHRFSGPRELALLGRTLHGITDPEAAD